MKRVYFSLGFISAATLAFQMALTRFFALAQGSHMAFMAVSLALLGAGASGTYLFLRRVGPANVPRLPAGGSMLFAVSAPLAYLTINRLPFDAYRIAWEPVQLVWLALYYLALTVPFFFGGLVIGSALSAGPRRAEPLYAANLLGSGLGPPLALAALATVGGPGAVFLCALLGWLAAAGLMFDVRGPGGRGSPVAFRWAAYCAAAVVLVYLTLRPPSSFEVRLTP
ncbi:MAG: hypothetical protein ACE5G8_09910, partial [Anaerolineae bacterium]